MKFLPKVLLLFLFPLAVVGQNKIQKEQLASDYYAKGLAKRTILKDSSYYYFDLAYELSYEIENYGDALDAVIEAMITSADFYDLEHQRSYLQQIERLLQEETMRSALTASDDLKYYQNRLINDQANYLYKLKDYNGAKIKSMELRNRFADKDVSTLDIYDLTHLVYSTQTLAAISMNTGKYDLAENYLNQALGFSAKNEMGKKRRLDRGTKRLLSQLYILTGNHQKADMVLSGLLEDYKTLFIDNREYKNSLITVYQRTVNNLIQQDSLQQAILFLDESQEYLIEEDPFYKQSLLLYGDIYMKLGHEQKALDYYKNALTFFQEYRQNRPHQDIAEVYGKITELYLKQKKFPEGLETIKKAFYAAGSSIRITDINQNPDPINVFSKRQLLHLLDIKLQLLQGSYEKTANATYQNACLQTSRDVLKTFDLLKSEFDSKLDKQFLVDKAYPIFHRLMEIAHNAYLKSPSEETLQLALNIAEKNKDFVLLEALRNAQATQYGNVPQKVLDKEAQLRTEITLLERQIFDAAETKIGFSEELISLKQEYYGFLDTIKTNYPKYHELKYLSVALDLTSVRENILGDNSTLVSYTMTEEYLYTIVLEDSKENFLKLPFSVVDRKAIREFYEVLSSPSIGDSQNLISDLGKSLYDKILKKPLEGFDTENLTIIPDGELHYLPFDLLQENSSYLLNTKSIGYSNSLTSLLELKNTEPAGQNRLVAFAPMFDNAIMEELPEEQTRQLGKLTYNDDEVNGIETLYNADTFIAERATLTNFKMNAPLFNVIHLATHASANDEYPDYSYLAFTAVKDSTERNILYVKDLYNTSLNADMVTLSACQTGIGKLQKGQGMLSLSKGFYYAGAKSLVTTLWKINDKSTVSLMEFFYQGLSEGKSKSTALRDAKLKYLGSVDDDLLKHPYYWAAFTVSGNTAPLHDPATQWLWLLVVPVAILGSWWLKRKTQSN